MLIVSFAFQKAKSTKEERLSNGLVRGHAFSITNIAEINTQGISTRIIRCKNPWGEFVVNL